MAKDLFRRILAWRVSEHFDPTMTLEVLVEAGKATARTDEPPSYTLLPKVLRGSWRDSVRGLGVRRRGHAEVTLITQDPMI